MMLTNSALLLLLTLRAQAPLDRALDEAPRPGTASEKYVGVTLGASGRNPLPVPGKGPPHLIWSGFAMADGTSRVFLQTTATVPFEVRPPEPGKGGTSSTVSVFLRNCRIHLKNNRRSLDTRFFASPVQGVTAIQRKKDVELRIALKSSASPVPRTEAGPGGTQFVVLEFPASPEAAGASTAAALGPASAGK